MTTTMTPVNAVTTIQVQGRAITVLNVAARGASGAAASSHIHTQASASAEWIINHNFGYRPGVTLYSVGGAEIDGEVVHISDMQARAYFATTVAGTARCL